MVGSAVHSTKAANARGDAHLSSRSTRTSQHITHTTSINRKDTTLSSRIKGTAVAVSSPSSSSSSSISNLFPSTNPRSSRSTNLGPGASATPQSSAQRTVDSNGAAPRPSDLSGGSRNAVIAATTIVGTLILVFLIYLIWRMRRGSTHSRFICCGDRSDTITVTTSRGGTMTALPIYRENRYSVRSSRIGSRLSLGKYRRERFDRDHPWTQNAWKTQNPPTPTSPLVNVRRAPSPPLKHLGTTRVYSSHTMESRMAKNNSEDTTKSGGVAIGVQGAPNELSPTESVFSLPLKPPEPPQKDRWSWTNADAPPTPRLAAPSIGKSSFSSLPRFRSVASWVRGQAARQGLRTEEPPLPSSQEGSMPILKNKASKPNLLPGPPTRKLSKNKRNDSSINAARPSIDDTGIATPTPAKLNHKRPPSPPKAEDGLFVSFS